MDYGDTLINISVSLSSTVAIVHQYDQSGQTHDTKGRMIDHQQQHISC